MGCGSLAEAGDSAAADREAVMANRERGGRKVDPAACVRLWQSGLSVSAIAERYGAHVTTVSDALRANGCKLNRRSRYDGEGGTIGRPGGALQRIASRS